MIADICSYKTALQGVNHYIKLQEGDSNFYKSIIESHKYSMKLLNCKINFYSQYKIDSLSANKTV